MLGVDSGTFGRSIDTHEFACLHLLSLGDAFVLLLR